MKILDTNQYIGEKLNIKPITKTRLADMCAHRYEHHPKTKFVLKRIIDDRIAAEGNLCDLNDIDVSAIVDMSHLFYKSNFNQDISKWDVSNVLSMESMFRGALFFDQDLSGWNVVKVSNSKHFANIYLSKYNSKMPKFNKVKKSKNDLYK